VSSERLATTHLVLVACCLLSGGCKYAPFFMTARRYEDFCSGVLHAYMAVETGGWLMSIL
jgi:hypothetical protein